LIYIAGGQSKADIRVMALTTLDTHELVKDLKAAGFTDDQAEAVTRAVKHVREIDFSDLATKADVANFATRADLAAVSAKVDTLALKLDHLATRLDNFVTKAEIADIKTELLKWGVGIALGQAAMIIALIKLLPGGHP
jgi:hypothetical protein